MHSKLHWYETSESILYHTSVFIIQTRNAKFVWIPYIKSSQHSQVEGHELQGDDTEDALQAVHSLRQLDGLVRVLSHLRVILATKDNGPTLTGREGVTGSTSVSQFMLTRC